MVSSMKLYRWIITVATLVSLRASASPLTPDSVQATTVSLSIEDANIGQTIASTMHGVILETNINRGDDGGLYAEMIYNRAFQEKSRSLDGWKVYGDASFNLSAVQPLSSALPAHMNFSIKSQSSTASGFYNSGFYGINVQAQTYQVSFFYKPSLGAFVTGNQLTVSFRDVTGQTTYGLSTVDVSAATVGNWSKLSVPIVVRAAAPTSNNTFVIEFPRGSSGDFAFNLISCFPPTFKDRPNGARLDIANAFLELKPGFIRLPGGNDLEGRTISSRFIWNHTIGPLEQRPGRKGTWTDFNTEGFGLLELMTFAEDIGAAPVLAVYAGFSLDQVSVPEDQLQPYIDEVIDEIDFLIAPAETNRMGALRASLGRREPFNISYVEIGNEDFYGLGLVTYKYRWPAYYNALSKRYPQMNFIATTTQLISPPPIVDDHHYRGPVFYIDNFRHFESLPRSGPKVLVGEFSVENNDDFQSEEVLEFGRLSYPTIKAAVAESIYRIGFERNSDIVVGGCYAPVLQNVHDTQWTPNFILFNNSFVVRSTSYLAQQMFGQHLGDLVLNSTAYRSDAGPRSVRKGQEGDGKLGKLYFVATKDTKSKTLIVKFASVDTNDVLVNAQIQSSATSSTGQAYTLSAGAGVDPATVQNTLADPDAASIKTSSVPVSNGAWTVTIPSWSVVVVTIPL